MKTATDEFRNAVHKRSRAFKFKLDFGDFIISSLNSFKTESISCSSAGLTFGTVAIGNGAFKGRKLGHTVNGKSFHAYIGLDIDGVTEYVKIGKYTVYNAVTKGIETTAEFQDDISKLDVDFAPTLTYPADVAAVLSYIETTCGVVFDKSNIPSALKVNKNLTGYSCRDVVGFIAQLIGCFACIDNATDKIAFKWYTDTGYTIDSDNYLYMIKEPVKGDAFELSLISCDADGAALSQGTGTGVVHIVNPIMTDSILQTVYTARAGFSYNEGNIQFVLGNPLLDIWDIVTATYNGVTTKIPCMNIKITFNGGFQSDISAYIRNKNSVFEGKMTKELGKLKTEISIIEGNVSSKVSKGEIISEINQSAEEIRISAKKINLKGAVTADDITSGAVTADKIASKAVRADKIDVDDLFAQDISMTGKFTNAVKAYLRPTVIEIEEVKELINNGTYDSRYDLNSDGVINETDLNAFESLKSGSDHFSDYPDFAVEESDVSLIIDLTNPDTAITFDGKNMWGSWLSASFGINALFANNSDDANLADLNYLLTLNHSQNLFQQALNRISALETSSGVTVDDALFSDSTNPVQNKVIYAALKDKADSSHTHNYAGSYKPGGPANSVRYGLTLRLNGDTSTQVQYDGSESRTFDATPSGLGIEDYTEDRVQELWDAIFNT